MRLRRAFSIEQKASAGVSWTDNAGGGALAFFSNAFTAFSRTAAVLA